MAKESTTTTEKDDKKPIPKSTRFTFLVYPESVQSNWVECLKNIGLPIAISPVHDLDEIKEKAKIEKMIAENKATLLQRESYEKGEKVYLKPHHHILYVAKNPVSVESVRNKVKRALGDKSVEKIQIVDNMEHIYLYLTHETEDAIAKGKTLYKSEDIILLNDFNIDNYITLSIEDKNVLREILLNLCKMYNVVNYVELMAIVDFEQLTIKWRMKDINDSIRDNSSLFRLVFDGNFQNGHRPRFGKIRNPETGEVVDGSTGEIVREKD